MCACALMNRSNVIMSTNQLKTEQFSVTLNSINVNFKFKAKPNFCNEFELNYIDFILVHVLMNTFIQYFTSDVQYIFIITYFVSFLKMCIM